MADAAETRLIDSYRAFAGHIRRRGRRGIGLLPLTLVALLVSWYAATASALPAPDSASALPKYELARPFVALK